MQSTVDDTTTLTAYIGSVEEVQTSGSTTQTTTYYAVGGKWVAADVNGTFYSFGYDALGSQVAVLNATGSLVGVQLYGPYGASRYNTGTLPTSIGFTGQRADRVTGLDYYNARYYDSAVGQFVSADSVQGNAQGMDPYAYVGENPESRTDPTGNKSCYNPSSDSVMVGCETKPLPPQSGGGSSGNGGGSTTKPTSTPNKPTTQHKQQSSNDASRAAKKARDQRVSDLESQMNWEFLAADVLVLSGLIYNAMNRFSLLSTISIIIGIVTLFGTNLLPHLASVIGATGGLYQALYQMASGLESALSWLEGLAAVYSSAAWWEKNVIDASVAAFKVSSLGPEQIIVTALMTVAKPVVGFLLDAGAQYLYSRGLADQAEIERQKDMPIAQWCASFHSC